MPLEISYTSARAKLAALCEQVTSDRDVVIIHRRGAEDVALIAADELRSLLETSHLLRSSQNAKRLLRALTRAIQEKTSPSTVRNLAQEVGLDSSS